MDVYGIHRISPEILENGEAISLLKIIKNSDIPILNSRHLDFYFKKCDKQLWKYYMYTMKSGGSDHAGEDMRSKASLDKNCDPSRNVFILLDSDEENETEKSQPCITNKDDDVFLFDIEADLSTARSSHVHSPRSSSPEIQILSSPLPSPTISRTRNDRQLLDTTWSSPPSPTHYNFDSLSPSYSSNRPMENVNNGITTSPSLFSNNSDDFLTLSPSLYDKPSSMDHDTQLILSDNDSVDALTSSSNFLSEIGINMDNTTCRTYTESKQSSSINTERKGNGKQIDTTLISTTPAKRTFISERLWEWDDDDDNDDGNSISLIDGGGSTSLIDNSCNTSQETSQLSTKEAKKLQRQMEQEAKKRTKEAALLRKQQEKEQAQQLKEQAKQLQQVNRLRKDRDELVKEMTVVVCDQSFMGSERGQLLRAVLSEKDTTIISQPTTTATASFTLTWKRNCKADWDEQQQQFIPFPNGQSKSKDERAALVFMTAESFVDIIDRDGVDMWIDSIQHMAGDKQLFLMIEGLEPFYKKKMNQWRRRFASTVLGNITEDNSNTNTSDDDQRMRASSGNTRPRKRKKKDDTSTNLIENGPSRDTIEETLTYLQVIKNVMLIQTLNEEDSVDWLVCLTTDLAKALYNNINTAALSKGQGGGSRSGVDADDVWSKMLQEIQNCTPAVAKSIVDEYPNLKALYQQYSQMTSSSARDCLLADLEVQRSVLSNKDRTINKFMSAKIHKIFMTGDPTNIIQ